MGKRTKTERAKLEARHYELEEAIALVRDCASAKFDETVDIAVRLGVNPRHSDQMVRGSVVMPGGTGKVVRVLVFAQGEKVTEAEAAGVVLGARVPIILTSRSDSPKCRLASSAVAALMVHARRKGDAGAVLGAPGVGHE